MVTVIVAVAGVFVVLSVWVLVDQLARRQLGERHHGCQAGRSGGHGGCGMCRAIAEQNESLHARPEDEGERDGRPVNERSYE